MIILESLGNKIYIRGRNQKGKRYTKVVKDFKPYCYIPDKDGEYKTINGISCSKIHVKNPSQIYGLKEKYDLTFESDVKFITKYLIDNFQQIEKEPIRVCFLDIEVDDRGEFPNVSEADKPILSICAYDNFKNKYYSFVLVNSRMEKELESFDISNVGKFLPESSALSNSSFKLFTFRKEKDLLRKFVTFIKEFDFDLISGWNAENFDFPYIFNRCDKFMINSKEFSPYEKTYKPTNLPMGRIWDDYMWSYKKLQTHELESLRLDYVGNYELGFGKIKHKKRVGDLWKEEIEKFIAYNLLDVAIMVKIEEKNGIYDYFDEIRRFTFSNWNDIRFNTRVLDCYYLKSAKAINIVLPNKGHGSFDEGKIAGARVISPKPGLHKNVICLDWKSLYPSAACTCNMSPETIINENEAIENNIPYVKVDDVCFRMDKRGFIPYIIDDLWNLRQEFKKEMKKHEYNSPEYKKWDNIQTVAKFLLNTVYGSLLASGFRLYNRDVGKSITYFGRENNKWMEEQIIKLGFSVLAGDTDSNYVESNSKTIEEQIADGKLLESTINSLTDQWCEETWGSSKYNRLELEFESLFSNVFFMRGDDEYETLKKRYAGLVCYSGKILDKPQIEIKGFDTKRSDTPQFVRDLQESILYNVLMEKNTEEILEPLKEAKEKILNNEFEPEEIGIPKGISKPIKSYKNKSAHIRGIEYYIKYCNGVYQTGDKVKYIYVKRSPKGLPNTNVISFVDYCPEGFEFDLEKMANLLIDRKFNRILDNLGISLKDLDGTQITTDGWF